uniref:Uncharacterized protein n=1 Tax=Rhabditophanes sp. KR3021 TaxID=114890 RepID=A0AC35U8N5_9BILA
MESEVCTMHFFALRKSALTMFMTNIRWRKLPEVTRCLKFTLRNDRTLPFIGRQQLYQAMCEIIREVQRWGSKHINLFPEPNLTNPSGSKRLFNGTDHLRLFYPYFVWKHSSYQIDDYETAKEIISKECINWPLMEFQFAACYAIQDSLNNDWKFDKLRRKTIRQQIGDHPVYDFWLSVLDDPVQWKRFFRPDAPLLSQPVSLILQFAMTNGFIELVKFIWLKISITHQESIGFICWKKICFRAQHREIVQFLCHHLCTINPTGLARLTWDCFYEKIYKATLDEDDLSSFDRKDNLHKLGLLLQSWCPRLREAMLARENYRAIGDMFRKNRKEEFALFLEYLNHSQLNMARDVVDRLFDIKRTTSNRQLRQMVIRRQNTVG